MVRPPPLNDCPGYDIKQSDGETPGVELWEMPSTPSLPSLPDPLWPEVISPYSVLSMSYLEQTVHKQISDVKLWLLYNNTWSYLIMYKMELKFVYECSLQNVFTNHI